MVDGRILWEGPSRIDGKPVVALITGLDGVVKNGKTGDMVQTWILRQDVSPGKASLNGEDKSVCGDCVHRATDGKGTCYVNTAWGPHAVWQAYKNDVYPKVAKEEQFWIRDMLHVRFGAYGDPVAVPRKVWLKILPLSPFDSTGYTHQWRSKIAREFKSFLMASVENEAEALEAQDKGWRTFLVVPLNRDVPKGYVWCPSDALNPADKVECKDCGLCSGTRLKVKKSVAIYVHGNAAQGYGIRERRANLPGERKGQVYDPLVRMAAPLHRIVKKHAKQKGYRGMKPFVTEAIKEKLARDGVRVPKGV